MVNNSCDLYLPVSFQLECQFSPLWRYRPRHRAPMAL